MIVATWQGVSRVAAACLIAQPAATQAPGGFGRCGAAREGLEEVMVARRSGTVSRASLSGPLHVVAVALPSSEWRFRPAAHGLELPR